MADAITSSSIISTSFRSTSNLCRPAALPCNQGRFRGRAVSVSGISPFSVRTHQRSDTFKVHAALGETEQPKWWERKCSSNMIAIHSKEELLNAFKLAGDRLVIVEFYGTWCGSCRALHPKLCKTAEEHGDILFLKVNFDENKIMCKNLNIRVLPYFHFYRGADGQLEAFSCPLSKFQRIKDAINRHNSSPAKEKKLQGSSGAF